MSELLRSLTKNERIACFFNEFLIRSFFCKKGAIRSENRRANFQPCLNGDVQELQLLLKKTTVKMTNLVKWMRRYTGTVYVE